MEEKKLELELFINGVPDIKQIPEDIAHALLCSLEEDIMKWLKEKNKIMFSKE